MIFISLQRSRISFFSISEFWFQASILLEVGNLISVNLDIFPSLVLIWTWGGRYADILYKVNVGWTIWSPWLYIYPGIHQHMLGPIWPMVRGSPRLLLHWFLILSKLSSMDRENVLLFPKQSGSTQCSEALSSATSTCHVSLFCARTPLSVQDQQFLIGSWTD